MNSLTDAQLVCVLAFGPLIIGASLAALANAAATYRRLTRP
nr:hypothetical protein [Methylobacterium sp. ZNC0032]